jgi:uncharacterized protein
MRAVVDSSVLISAFLTPGRVPDRVLRAAERGTFTLCLSREVLTETIDALLTKRAQLERLYSYPEEQIFTHAEGLMAAAELIESLPALSAVPNDPKDDMIVATALKAEADYLITGDRKHLIALGEYEGIKIVSPREFLEILAGREEAA